MGEIVLKPCPFCGHAATLLLHESGGASAVCDRPLDHTGCCSVNPISFADTASEAAEAWNTRPLVDAQLTAARARAERAEGALASLPDQIMAAAYQWTPGEDESSLIERAFETAAIIARTALAARGE